MADTDAYSQDVADLAGVDLTVVAVLSRGRYEVRKANGTLGIAEVRHHCAPWAEYRLIEGRWPRWKVLPEVTGPTEEATQ